MKGEKYGFEMIFTEIGLFPWPRLCSRKKITVAANAFIHIAGAINFSSRR